MRSVGVIGAGRVGTVLGAALREAGNDVVGVHTRSPLREGSLLAGVPAMSAADLAARADLLLLTVPDDTLPGIVDGLAVRPGTVVMHASGRYGAAVLAPLARQGAITIAAHPVMTFTGTSADLPRLIGCPYGVTTEHEDDAARLVDELRGEAFWIAEDERVTYHAALSHASNHMVALVADALDLLRRAGIDRPAELIRPLVTATLANVLDHGPAILTGPVARGDAQTVRAHVDAISREAPESLAGYLAMARVTADRARASGLIDDTARDRVLAALGATP